MSCLHSCLWSNLCNKMPFCRTEKQLVARWNAPFTSLPIFFEAPYLWLKKRWGSFTAIHSFPLYLKALLRLLAVLLWLSIFNTFYLVEPSYVHNISLCTCASAAASEPTNWAYEKRWTANKTCLQAGTSKFEWPWVKMLDPCSPSSSYCHTARLLELVQAQVKNSCRRLGVRSLKAAYNKQVLPVDGGGSSNSGWASEKEDRQIMTQERNTSTKLFNQSSGQRDIWEAWFVRTSSFEWGTH